MRLSILLSLTLLMPAAAFGQSWPEGWQVRTDRAGVDAAEIEFSEMAPGYHVTTGPAAIFWRDDDLAGGRYRVDLESRLFDPEGRREAFGVFIGGANLSGDGQRYVYFLIRDGGDFLVKARDGRETSTLVQWTSHPAIRSFADRVEGRASVVNDLAVEADDDEIRFYVNGSEVTSIARPPGTSEGIAGLRVNHNLNLHVAKFAISPIES